MPESAVPSINSSKRTSKKSRKKQKVNKISIFFLENSNKLVVPMSRTSYLSFFVRLMIWYDSFHLEGAKITKNFDKAVNAMVP